MDKDRIEGSAAEIKGKIKEVAGKVLGDAKLESEGKADQAAGKVQNAVGGIKDTLKGKSPQRWGSWRREPHASHCCRHVSASASNLPRITKDGGSSATLRAFTCEGVSSWTTEPHKPKFQGRCDMSTILIILVLFLLLGGGGYYGHSMYGGAGLGGVLGLVLLIVVVAWLVGGLRIGGLGRGCGGVLDPNRR
jgi:uncharacterized protein YjbJ (UPF0337 family)